MKPTIWHDCYESGWSGQITPESFSHPAKFARGLIERIYRHCREQGWLVPGDTVGDPFGGVGTGGVMAAYNGLHWIGVELEPKFVKLAMDNFTMHARHWQQLRLPQPTILQGDSRRFDDLVRAHAVVTSPPYAGIAAGAGGLNTKPASKPGQQSGRNPQALSQQADQKYGSQPGQISQLKEGSLDAAVTSPPYAESIRNVERAGTDPEASDRKCGPHSQQASRAGYGGAQGQIGALPSGQVGAVVTSPPYISGGHHADQMGAWNANGRGQGMTKDEANYGQQSGQIGRLKPGELDAAITSPPWMKNAEGSRKGKKFKDQSAILKCKRGHGASDAAVLAQAKRDEAKTYGDSPGQISSLKGGSLDATVTSPPYEKRQVDPMSESYKRHRAASGRDPNAPSQAHQSWGKELGQVGNATGETYWQAMHAVYAACFRAIKPTGIIAVVVKDYVKNKQRVPLCDDTARLLRHVGFEIIERVHAMLVQETRHADLFEGHTTTKKERKGFFRRLAEAKGSPKIDWEEVIFARRP